MKVCIMFENESFYLYNPNIEISTNSENKYYFKINNRKFSLSKEIFESIRQSLYEECCKDLCLIVKKNKIINVKNTYI